MVQFEPNERIPMATVEEELKKLLSKWTCFLLSQVFGHASLHWAIRIRSICLVAASICNTVTDEINESFLQSYESLLQRNEGIAFVNYFPMLQCWRTVPFNVTLVWDILSRIKCILSFVYWEQWATINFMLQVHLIYMTRVARADQSSDSEKMFVWFVQRN